MTPFGLQVSHCLDTPSGMLFVHTRSLTFDYCLLVLCPADLDSQVLQDQRAQPEKKVCPAPYRSHIPAASGIHKRHRAAQDRHLFKKFFYPVDPHNAAEVSMFMSLYSEHEPKHLKGFQSMAAHWNAIKWAQRNNAMYLAVAYKDGVHLRNSHRVLSAEIGRNESLKLAGLLQDSQPSSPPASADPAQPLAALADPSTSAQPSLPLDHDVLGCEVSVEAGSGSRMHEPVQSGPECSEPSTSAKLPSTLLQKLSAAKQSLPFHATQQQKSPNRKAAKKPKTSTAAADHGQQTKGQKCRACLPMTGIGQHWHRLVVHLLICPPSHPCTSREIKATEAVVLTRKCIGSGLALAMDRPWQWSFGSGWALYVSVVQCRTCYFYATVDEQAAQVTCQYVKSAL